MKPLEERIATLPAAEAQGVPKMKMTTDIPPEITTPDSVKTRIGTLDFFDGFPDDKTTQLVYDNLDFMRGVQAFLRGIPGASIQAFLPAAKKFGGVDGNVMLFEELMDSKALWLRRTIPAFTSSLGSIPPRGQSCWKLHPMSWASSTIIGSAGSATMAMPVQTRARAVSS